MIELRCILKEFSASLLQQFGHIGSDRKKQLWYRPGHVFVKLNNGKKVLGLPTTVLTKQRLLFLPPGSLELDFEDCPLFDVLLPNFGEKGIFLVQHNGHVAAWAFSTSSSAWNLTGEFELGEGLKVINVTLNEEVKTIFWCEELQDETSSKCSYSVCSRTMPHEKESLSSATVGSRMVLLDNCPQCDLYSLENALLIWPTHPAPPGLFLKWFHSLKRLEVHVRERGCVLTEDRVFNTVNFMQLCMKLVGVWGQKCAVINICAKLYNPEMKVLHLILRSAEVQTIDKSLDVIKTCSLKNLTDSILQDLSCHWFTYSKFIGCYQSQTLWFYESLTGNLVEKCNISSYGELIGFWSHTGDISRTGVATESGLYEFQIKAINLPGNNIIPSSNAAIRHSTTQLALEEAQQYFKKRSINNMTVPEDLLLNTEIFQSPALVVALLQQGKEAEMNPQLAQQLDTLTKRFGDGGKLLVSQLNQSIAPLLSEYWRMETKIQSIISSSEGMPEFVKETVFNELQRVLDVATDLSNDARRVNLEILAQRFPSEVLEGLLEYLDFGVEIVTSDHIQRWQAVLSAETENLSEGQSKFPLFEIIVRLLYIQQPAILVKFVTVAQQICERTTGGSAFVRKKQQQMQFYDRAVSCIPSPELSSSLEGAVISKVQLLLRSSQLHSSIQALNLLLQYGLWETAINLVKQIGNTAVGYEELFHILITTALKEGVFGTYTTHIMELIPKTMDILVLLQLFQEYLPCSTSHIFANSNNGDVSFGALRTYFQQMIVEKETH